MTTDKARKRAVRSRMQKTGERYAAARRHVVHAGDQPALPPLPPRVADPGVSEAAITKGTGQGWDHWFRVLDDWGATSRSHTEIARYVNGEHGVDGWWAQSVTVGYERARGMRARNERPEGFEVSVSKTLRDPRHGRLARVRRAEPPSSLARSRPADADRHPHDGPLGPIRCARRGHARERLSHARRSDDRTTVTVTHVKLDGADDVAAHRTAWKGRLARLAAETSAGATAGSGTKVASRGATRRSQAS